MRGRKKRKRTDQKTDHAGLLEQDENFYFIAGYTAGGFAYGVTWEQYEEHEAEQGGGLINMNEAGDDHVKELKLNKQQFQELVDTFGMYIEGMESFLNIETGDVVMLRTFDQDQDEEDEELSEMVEEGYNEIYFSIPQLESFEGFEDMVDFAATVEDEQLKSTLMYILNGGKGVFRRFKDALSSDRKQLERYYRFVEERNGVRVSDWLESIDVKLILE
ncbi:hypothetical protein DQG13_11815 [Paenibacillus sp. YN15]|nr:hypothetical protein DQG13_11815 [Paenibacillus sp. YN15]